MRSPPTIAFTTDLRGDDLAAFHSAMALAAASGGKVVTVHATTGTPPAESVPRAPAWASEVAHETMIHACCDDVTDTLLDALRKVGPDLVVIATHGRGALAQLLSESVAEAVARNADRPVLVVPVEGRGLAGAMDGAIDLRRILVPAGDADATRAGLDAATWLVDLAGARDAELVLLHVDDGTPEPPLPEALPPGMRVTRRIVRGAVDEALVEAARELHACAVVSATRGHDGLLDVIAGSHTERVLRGVACPVLSVRIP